MKKLLTLFTMLLCAIGLSAASYEIRVAGIQVTDANKDNITGPGITAGTVKYNPTANMLILNNATIKVSGSDEAIWYGIMGGSEFTLKFDGTCYVESSGSRHAIALRGATNIASTGSSPNITVKYTGTSNKQAIYTEGNIRITCGGKLTASSTGDYAIRDYDQVNSFTTNKVITVDATANTAAIYGFKTMTIPGEACLTYPRAGVWKDSEKTFVSYSTGTTPATHVTIARGYPLWVNGTHVTPDNASDILGDNLVKYSAGSKTLELYGGSFTNTTSGERSIEANQDLTIDVMDATVSFEQKQAGFSAVALRGGHKYKFMGLEGNGTINITASGQPGIQLFDGSTVEFDHITANITTQFYPISASRGGSVVFNNSDIVLDGKGSTTFLDINNCTFTSCGITNPTGVSFNATKKTFVNSDGTTCNSKVTIAPTSYGISVIGKDINTRNYESLWYNTTYNPTTNTLSIHGDLGYSGNVISIKSGKPTTILLGSSTKILSDNASGIYISNTDVTIKKSSSTANAVLNVETKYVKGSGANTYTPIMNFGNGKLTIEDCTVNTTALEFGIYSSSKGTININNATVNANIKNNGLYHGAIEGFKNINLNKATIKSTSPGIYSDNMTPQIDLTGSNTITTTKGHGIFLTGSVVDNSVITISSKNDGSLSVTSPTDASLGYCSMMFEPDLLIKDCSVDFTGGSSGLIGRSGLQALTVDNATVKAKSSLSSSDSGALKGVKALTLKNGIAITSPKNAVYNSTLKGITADGTTLCKEVTISTEEYGITVADVKVTSKNCTNIPVTSGTAKYDPTTKVLTLSNATINAATSGIIADEEITLKLIGNNYINSSSNCITARKTSFTIDGAGSGKLYLKSTGTSGLGIYAVDIPMTIKDCTIDSEGNSGIIGLNNHEKALILENANIHVKATGAKPRAMVNFSSITLNKCYVESPNGAAFDATLKGMAEDYGELCKEVEILAGDNPHIVPPVISNPVVKIVEHSHSSIKLSWTAATDNNTTAAEMEYFVLYTNKATSEAKDFYVHGATSTEITGLDPATEYEIKITAIDKDGNLADYSVFTIKTLNAPDHTCPTLPADATISYHDLTANSVVVTWNPATDDITEPISLMYEIGCRVKGSTTPITYYYLTGDYTSFKFTGLLPETTYEVLMDVFDEAGNESYYEMLTFTTLADADVTKPALPADPTVTVTGTTENSISIKWNPATDDKTAEAAMRYQIDCFISEAWVTKGTVTGTTEFTIDGLEDGTSYQIVVYALDEADNKESYPLVIGTTLTASAIDAILAKYPDAKMYSLDGKLVDKNTYRGIVIINGKKYMKK